MPIQLPHNIKNRTLPLFMVFCMVLSLLPSGIVKAASNQLLVTPNSAAMTVGDEQVFYIKAYIDTTTPAQTASGSVTFSSGLLQAKNIATSDGWSGAPTINQSQGTISFNLTRTSSNTGFSTLFSVTFRALSGGTGVAGFSGDSRVNNTTTIYKSASMSISNPNPNPAPAPPKPTSTPKPTVTPVPIISTTPVPTPTPSTEPLPTPDPTGIVDKVVVKTKYNAASVNWSVNASNPQSIFRYGATASTLDKQGDVQKMPDGSFETTIQGLEPGKRYYFSITGSGDNNTEGTYSGTIIANGYPVTLTITENNLPVKGAQIKIGNRSYTTASSGKVSIGLASGEYTVAVTTETASSTFELVVAKKTIPTDGSPPESQLYSFGLSSSALAQGPGSGTTILTFLAVLLGGTVILGFGFFAFMAYRRRKFENGSAQNTSTVIIEDGYDWRQESPAVDASPTSHLPQAQAPPAQKQHNNSVYLNEDEPLDMFEQDNRLK